MKRRAGLFLLATAATVALLMACTTPSTPSTPRPEGAAAAALRVTGSVAYRERIALPPDSEIVVQLQDVSRMDAPAVVLAEQRIRPGGKQVPFAFELQVDPARIDPRMRYSVSARILQGGQLMFINDTSYPVLTQGQGTSVNMMLVRVTPSPR